jgi:putative ABC transport system substrate-binding protein
VKFRYIEVRTPICMGDAAVVATILLVLLALPLSCPAAEKTIGVIMTGDIPYYNDLHTAFMTKLGQRGPVSRKEVIVQKPYPDNISLSNAARKFIAMEVDVIVVYGAPAAVAVAKERTKIPMVYAAVYEPFIADLKTRYSTGVYIKLSMSSLLRYLRSLHQIRTLGVVYSSNEEDSVYQFSELAKLAAQHGMKIDGINLKRHQDAQSKLAGRQVDAVLLAGSSVAHMAMGQIIEYAKVRKIPYASFSLSPDARAMIALAARPDSQGEIAAEKVQKILDGVPPDKIKSEPATEIELIFNMRDANAMGMKIPMDLVIEATRLIK